ncbi:hypothetical protein [Microbacterium sp. SORGH_AS_0888]|uniref:hypothetical protein n=1 Tax=Microbacterium sp. SORGH_AS_0888 TaxID=3041791 RepID=UPI00278919C0|nr:hypothetical protein [Microbacterium sp. SORGH_AS_0888]MDQ1130676.1 hypothetical protein [Microbacterium sp. SORGH_AS_0888]
MGTVNHRIRPGYDVTLAMIEGTEVRSLCAISFVPTVQVGTSGLATDPTAPDCPECQDLYDITREAWEAKKRRNAANRDLYAAKKRYRERVDEILKAREHQGEPVHH